MTPLAALPVFGSNPNDPDGDKDDDNDGYDADRDGESSAEEMYTNLEEYNNNTNPNLINQVFTDQLDLLMK